MKRNVKILIVEDDPGVARLLLRVMGEIGYSAHAENNGLRALELVQTDNFDLILLDVMLPGISGFEFCRRARTAKITTPILILTARDVVSDKVEGLDAGADDYLVKPFQIVELLARVRALLRRGGASPPATLSVGDLTLDPATRAASRGERRLRFSATEYALLEYLMRNAGRVLTRSLILEHVWQYDFNGAHNVLDVYIGYLRGKIDKNAPEPLIHTVRGVGFVMESRGETLP